LPPNITTYTSLPSPSDRCGHCCSDVQLIATSGSFYRTEPNHFSLLYDLEVFFITLWHSN